MGGDSRNSRAERTRLALERYERQLVHFAAGITGDLERARDVVQETFFRLWNEDDSVNDHLGGWLFTVCRNLAIDAVRKEKRLRPLDETQGDAATDTTASPLAAAEEAERQLAVVTALGRLGEVQRQVVQLRLQAGLSYKEIAAATGLTVNHVGVALYHGIRELRKQLGATEPRPKHLKTAEGGGER